MKLTKRGVVPITEGDKIRNITCSKCSSEYEYTRNDKEIKTYAGDQREHMDYSYSYFVCVVCKGQIRI